MITLNRQSKRISLPNMLSSQKVYRHEKIFHSVYKIRQFQTFVHASRMMQPLKRFVPRFGIYNLRVVPQTWWLKETSYSRFIQLKIHMPLFEGHWHSQSRELLGKTTNTTISLFQCLIRFQKGYYGRSTSVSARPYTNVLVNSDLESAER